MTVDQNSALTVEELRRQAEEGDAAAVIELAGRLLDGERVSRNAREGEQLLRQATESGNTDAMTELAVRLLDGKGVQTHSKEGEQWLRRAAEAGNVKAMWKLGDRLATGNRLPQNRADAKVWLRRAVEAGDVDAMASFGLLCYEMRDYAEAARFFLMGYRAGAVAEGNNVAYMIRRSEIPAGLEVPSLDELLDPLVAEQSPLALVNQALRLARGIQCEVNWEKADETLAALGDTTKASEVLNWWWGLADRGEAEGHLVLGWLMRHRLGTDPNGLTVSKRMARARKGGWDVPAWMDQVKKP